MGVPFPDINPYEILEVSQDASPIEIKKSYKKLCLKYHPDKLQQQKDLVIEEEYFTKIQFSFSILNDPIKRTRYDTLGSLSDFNDDYDDDGGFDWKEYFASMNDKITIEMIEEDKLKYQNSEEEKSDIITNFVYYEGDFLRLFEVIPHLEFTEPEEQRVFKIIEIEIQTLKLDKQILKSWEKYTKSRKTKVKSMLNKIAKEAKEAKELENLIQQKNKGKKQDLKSMIKSRQNNRFDDLISKMESKYKNKKGKKRVVGDIDDDEFDRIQQEMLKKKR
ncbi:uncharacterized protein KGF55_001254 [Candida pseudojiufengensis]|uniref:uncharacterized protein n=1 Tax=Candida pseudojiufengensis TaxID=497109 RepID=UPI002224BB40|nr:uncharacterized protein KGF55_001254 [Candida pseudojiufengensis]KAI5965890.1 hypothetical protein KGF55_001254 [Candida pseudojiufengensis]